jgi:hypothetical protein
VDLQAGMVGIARDLLGETRRCRNFERRAHVSAVLGAVAASSNVAEVWRAEEPRCADAWLLCARVDVVRALALFDREGPTPQATARLMAAMSLCRQAYAEAGYDPVVWVAALALLRARLWPPVEPTARELAPLSEIPGPWDLVENVIMTQLPGHREAGHRLLRYFSPRCGGRNEDHATVAMWLSGQVKPGHPWRLLPVVVALDHDPEQERAAADERAVSGARVRTIRDMLKQLGSVPSQRTAQDVEHRRDQLTAVLRSEVQPEPWQARRDRMGRAAEEVFRAWFPASPDGQTAIPVGVPITDVSLLAWGLYASGQRDLAGQVLRHMYPYAPQYPWSRFGDPAVVLDQAYRECLGLTVLRDRPG